MQIYIKNRILSEKKYMAFHFLKCAVAVLVLKLLFNMIKSGFEIQSHFRILRRKICKLLPCIIMLSLEDKFMCVVADMAQFPKTTLGG